MLIENIFEEDIPFIQKLQPDGWSNIVPKFQFYIKNKSWCNPVKVKIDNQIVGVGCGIIFNKTGWLAHIIVDSNYRKQGIGTFIVNNLCNLLKVNGVETISLIATEYGYPVYEKIGFIKETEYAFFEKEDVLLQNISNNIKNYSECYEQEIYDLDKIVSGEERYPLINLYLEKSMLYIKDDKVLGFYIPELDEGLIIANNVEAGIELMKLRYSKTNKGVLPVDNLEGIQFLKNNGFKEIKRAKRMVYGNLYLWDKKCLFNRIAGNFG